MPDYSWPPPENRTLIGKRISRVDSPVKVSGRAKYTYDYNPSGMLYGKILRSPHAKAKIVSIDTSAAEKMPGVKAVQIAQKVGTTVQWAGDEVVAVAAVDEATAEDAIRAIKVTYQPLPHLVSDTEPPAGAAESPGPLSFDDYHNSRWIAWPLASTARAKFSAL
jgi:xanthine dehydrogenase YagR molybdenum-binding subunit